MAKKLFKIICPILAGAAFFSGCQNPYEDLKNGKFNYKQREFLSSIHGLYGDEVSYNEMKEYIKSKLEKNKAGIVTKCLKEHGKEKSNLENLDDSALVVVYEAIRRLD